MNFSKGEVLTAKPKDEIFRSLWNLFSRAVLLWERPVSSVLLAFPLYAFLAMQQSQLSLWHPSKIAYYNYLADAFLHGQLHLRLIPPTIHDLILFDAKYYLYWPPMPAIFLIPFVGAFGVNFSDIIFTLSIAAVNVFLVASLLRQACRRRIIKLSKVQRACLVLFFALGTVHVTLAPYGRIWSTGQVLGFFFLILAYLAALVLEGRLALALTGLMLAGTFLTRNHMILAGLWPACYLLHRYKMSGRRNVSTDAIIGILPIAIGFGLLAVYNWLRFGSVFDNGINYHLMAREFAPDFQQYGAFSLHYVPTNLFYQYVAYPLPWHLTTFYGGSLFLLSPVFAAVFWGLARGQPRWSVWILFVSILLVAIPIITLMGTGWIQFGPRYTLDFTVPLLLLTALGVRHWSNWVLALLTLLSVVQYLIGTAHLGAYLAAINNL